MASSITLYSISDDPKVVNKTLGSAQAGPLSCTPYEPLSDLEGYVILAYNSTRKACNYALLDNKYYYITDREMLTGSQLKLKLKVDVLRTYVNTNDFKALKVIPSRSEDQYNSWILDGKQPYEVAKENVIIDPDPDSYSSALPDACLDYSKLSIIAAVVGTDQPTNTLVENN